jgi:C-terminal processing protease CtpA/Prc
VSPWWAPSVTATRLAAAAVALGVPAIAAAASAVDRLLEAAAVYGLAVPDETVQEVRAACGADALCVARRIAAAGEGRVRLERRRHPDTDTIRWVTTRASLQRPEAAGDDRGVIVLARFGRKVEWELRDALRERSTDSTLVLDLRSNHGGDFGRMLRVAGLFTGALDQALYLADGASRRPVGIPGGDRATHTGRLVVLVGPETASSGEILAALLRRHAGAELRGARTAGKDHLLRVVPVDHDWRLLLPGERVEVPGETLAGGLVPDGPLAGVPASGAAP